MKSIIGFTGKKAKKQKSKISSIATASLKDADFFDIDINLIEHCGNCEKNKAWKNKGKQKDKISRAAIFFKRCAKMPKLN